MGTRFTRGRFLTVVGAGAACVALTNAVGCEPPERASRVVPLPGVSSASASANGVWAFRSRPDLSPAAAEVTRQGQGTAPGYVFVALKEGAGEHGPMIIDDLGRPVWFGQY